RSNSKDRPHRARLLATLIAGTLLAQPIAGCNDGRSSSRKIQPARTFAAPTKVDARGHRMSRPFGCSGNPFYYDHDAKQWVYYDHDGTVHVSPTQPPCAGAERVLIEPAQPAP